METQTEVQTIAKTEKKIYNGIAAKAMKYLANGATESETAQALGVSKSLISQYLAEAEYKEQLVVLINQSMESSREIDENYVETEKVLSKRLRDQAQMMFNPDSILRVLKFTNEAKKKIIQNPGSNPNGSGGGAGISMKPVILILPQVVRKEFVLNPNNEIVGIDKEPLNTITSTRLNVLVKEKENSTNIDYIESKPKELKVVPKNGTTKHLPSSDDYYSDL